VKLRGWLTIPQAAEVLHLGRTSVYRIVVELREVDPIEVLSIGSMCVLIDKKAVDRLYAVRAGEAHHIAKAKKEANVQRLRKLFFALDGELSEDSVFEISVRTPSK
jgi:hypothetical protein